MSIPEKLYYSLAEAADKIKCHEKHLIHYFSHGYTQFHYLIVGKKTTKFQLMQNVITSEGNDNCWVMKFDDIKTICIDNHQWYRRNFQNSLCYWAFDPLEENWVNNAPTQFSVFFTGLFEVQAPKSFNDLFCTPDGEMGFNIKLTIPLPEKIKSNGEILLTAENGFVSKDLLYLHNDNLEKLLNKKVPTNNQPTAKTINKQAELIAQLIYLQFGEEALRNLAYHANPENKNPIISEKLTAAGFRPPAKGVILRWLQDANVNVNDIIAAAKEHLSHRK